MLFNTSFVYGTKYYTQHGNVVFTKTSLSSGIQTDTIKKNGLFLQNDKIEKKSKRKKIYRTGLGMSIASIIIIGVLFIDAWKSRNDPPGSLGDITLFGVILSFLLIIFIITGPILLVISLIWKWIENSRARDRQKEKGSTPIDPIY